MTYQATKALLEAKQTELTKRLSAVKSDLQKSHSQDFAEQASERENDDVLRGITLETEADLALVKSALQRIASGEYGICKSCGSDISKMRLQILPEAITCADCANLQQ